MNSEQRKRVAARFARAWKRQIRIEEGRGYRQDNRKRLGTRLRENTRIAMMVMTVIAGAVLLALWLR
jgi:hypothetical protein